MTSAHTIGLFRGPEITPWLDDVARLRVAVFRDWPYLYEGDADYERDYLGAYARSAESVFVLAMEKGEVIGASTGLPLADDTEAFRRPFVDGAIDPEDVYERRPGMTMRLPWSEIGQGEVDHALTFWLRPLETAR